MLSWPSFQCSAQLNSMLCNNACKGQGIFSHLVNLYPVERLLGDEEEDVRAGLEAEDLLVFLQSHNLSVKRIGGIIRPNKKTASTSVKSITS